MFFTAYSFQNVPREGKLKEQILSIAKEQLITKPAPIVKSIAEEIPPDHHDAFWSLLGEAEVGYLRQLQCPTPQKSCSAFDEALKPCMTQKNMYSTSSRSSSCHC